MSRFQDPSRTDAEPTRTTLAAIGDTPIVELPSMRPDETVVTVACDTGLT